MGFLLAGNGLLVVYITIMVYKKVSIPPADIAKTAHNQHQLQSVCVPAHGACCGVFLAWHLMLL